MKCTRKQAERIDSLLAGMNFYYCSPSKFIDGSIQISVGALYEIKDFDTAMDVIIKISDLDTGEDPDYLLENVKEILDSSLSNSLNS